MQRILSTLVLLAWGLWFGGIILVFIAVSTLFKTFDSQREVAGAAAGAIFHRFHVFQLVLAAASLLAVFAWRLAPGAQRLKTALFSLLGLATIGAYVVTAVLTPRIDAIQQRSLAQPELELTRGTEFRHLHGMSMMTYVAVAAALLAAGLVIPAIIRAESAKGLGAGDGSPPDRAPAPASR